MISAPKQMADSTAVVPRSSVNVGKKRNNPERQTRERREFAPSLYIWVWDNCCDRRTQNGPRRLPVLDRISCSPLEKKKKEIKQETVDQPAGCQALLINLGHGQHLQR